MYDLSKNNNNKELSRVPSTYHTWTSFQRKWKRRKGGKGWKEKGNLGRASVDLCDPSYHIQAPLPPKQTNSIFLSTEQFSIHTNLHYPIPTHLTTTLNKFKYKKLLLMEIFFHYSLPFSYFNSIFTCPATLSRRIQQSNVTCLFYLIFFFLLFFLFVFFSSSSFPASSSLICPHYTNGLLTKTP